MLRDTEDAVIISTRAHADHRSDVEEGNEIEIHRWVSSMLYEKEPKRL